MSAAPGRCQGEQHRSAWRAGCPVSQFQAAGCSCQGRDQVPTSGQDPADRIGSDMQQQPDPGPPQAGDPHDTEGAPNAAIGRMGQGRERPAAEELDAALHAHRRNTRDAQARDALLLLLYRSIAVQARVLIARQFRSLAHREDELVLRTLARIEGQDPGKVENEGGMAEQVVLLADYEFRSVRRTIYSYVLQKTGNIARNMQAEAYVPDGGFWSNDLKDRFKALRPQDEARMKGPRGGVQIEVPIGSPDDDEPPTRVLSPFPRHCGCRKHRCANPSCASTRWPASSTRWRRTWLARP